MEPTPKLSREAYIQAMRQRVETLLGQVADAVNQAAPGQIITGSEEKVRDPFADLRREAFEQATCSGRVHPGPRSSFTSAR